MILKGPRVTIRPMRRDDLYVMARWRRSADPVYQPFDFPQRSRFDHDLWFDERVDDPTRRLWTVEDERGEIIGSLTLREITTTPPASARLGITLGAVFTDQGYGTEILRTLLPHFFETMGFDLMLLDVAATNQRAVHLYRSLGFRDTGWHYETVNHPSYRTLEQNPRYRSLRPFLRRRGSVLQVLFYDMALNREEWQRRADQCSRQPVAPAV